MEIKEYKALNLEEMPIKVYTARCSFNSFDRIEMKKYDIKGSYEEKEIIGFQNNKSVGISFTTNGENKLFNKLFIYHGKNPNKIFTTEAEAIAWSKTDKGYIE